MCLLSAWGMYWFIDVWELFKVYLCCVFYGCNSVWLSFCQWCWNEQFKWLKTCLFIYKLWTTVFLWQSHLSQSLFIFHCFVSDVITPLIRTVAARRIACMNTWSKIFGRRDDNTVRLDQSFLRKSLPNVLFWCWVSLLALTPIFPFNCQ